MNAEKETELRAAVNEWTQLQVQIQAAIKPVQDRLNAAIKAMSEPDDPPPTDPPSLKADRAAG